MPFVVAVYGNGATAKSKAERIAELTRSTLTGDLKPAGVYPEYRDWWSYELDHVTVHVTYGLGGGYEKAHLMADALTSALADEFPGVSVSVKHDTD